MKEIIDELIKLNIVVKVQGEQLKVEGPKDKLTPDLVDKIKSNKRSLLEYLQAVRLKDYLVEEIPVVPHQGEEGYTLSSAQKRMLLLTHLHESERAFYNIYGAYALEGPLDVQALQQAYEVLVSRHEILRTTYVKGRNGQVKQHVHPASSIGNITYSNLLQTPQSGDVVAYIKNAINIKFDLAKGPLLKAELISIAPDEHIFLYTMHHINSDGWSIENIMAELMKLYHHFSLGDVFQLPPLRIHYKDYAAWQQALFNDGKLDSHKDYWVNQFSGELPAMDLPTDFVRPPTRSGKGGTVKLLISEAQSSKLTAMTREVGASLFMGLSALVNALLFRYTRQKDIITGTPIAGREHVDLQSQIGFYVNVLPLRICLSEHECFRSLLESVRDVTLAAYEHQVYPFDELVSALGIARDISRNALFDVAVSLRNNTMFKNSVGASPILIKELSLLEDAISRYDLAFDFKEVADGIAVTVEYSVDLFKRESAERIGEHFKNLFREAMLHPNEPISFLQYLGEQEQDIMMTKFNNTKIDYPLDKHPIAFFQEIVAHYGSSLAVIDRNQSVSYEKLDLLSDALAKYFHEAAGLKKGDHVGVFMDKSVEAIVVFIGLLKAELVYVPMNPNDATIRIDHIFSDAAIAFVCVDERYETTLEKIVHGKPFVRQETITLKWLGTLAQGKVMRHRAIENLAYILYTSGSTGMPKGVVVNCSGLVNISFDHRDRLPILSSDKVIQFIPLSFDGSILDILMTLLSGATLVMPSIDEVSDPVAFSSLINNTNATIASFTPSYFRFLAGLEMPSVKILISVGEAVDPEIARYYIGLGKSFFNGYGPTETTVNAALHKVRLTDLDNPMGIPIGGPSANKKIAIVDENMQILPCGVSGQICIWGNGLANGYLNQPGLTHEKFIDNPFEKGSLLYKTGDVGFWTEQGNIIYKGRTDSQIKVRGYRVELGEIESAMDKHESIEKAVVLQHVNEEGNKELISFCVFNSNVGHVAKKVIESENSAKEKYLIFELDKGLSMYAARKSELTLVYKEIVTDNSYLRYGVCIPDNAVIFDVGANIGMFSVYASLIAKNSTIFAFEPLPPNFELLQRNASLYSSSVRPLNIGLSHQEETAVFKYYPYVTAMSSRYIDEVVALDAVRQFVLNTEKTNIESLDPDQLDQMFKERLKSEEFSCKLKTLSQIIAEYKIDKIDILKIDVEHAELDVLNGIYSQDWQKIDQIVIEIHNEDGRLSLITALLVKHGFDFKVEQLADLSGTAMFNLYAKHPRSGSIKNEHEHKAIPSEYRYGVESTKRNITEYLQKRLPSYMIPSQVVPTEKFLTVNEKINRKVLLDQFGQLQKKSSYVAPTTQIEHMLVEIWSEVLIRNDERIGLKDNFFTLGGHSLSAMRIINKINETLEVDVDLSVFFNQPTIEALARAVDAVLRERKQQETLQMVDRKTV